MDGSRAAAAGTGALLVALLVVAGAVGGSGPRPPSPPQPTAAADPARPEAPVAAASPAEDVAELVAAADALAEASTAVSASQAAAIAADAAAAAAGSGGGGSTGGGASGGGGMPQPTGTRTQPVYASNHLDMTGTGMCTYGDILYQTNVAWYETDTFGLTIGAPWVALVSPFVFGEIDSILSYRLCT